MKFRSMILLGLLCALASGTLFAQQTVTLGDVVTTNNSWPFNYPSGPGRYHTAYSATELGMTGGATISEIRIHGSNVTPGTYGLTLNLGYTPFATNALTGTWANNYSTGSQQTVLGPVSYTPTKLTGNWYSFVFSTPFQYDGTSTLLVDWIITSRTGSGFTVSSSTPPSPLLSRARVYNSSSATATTGSVSSTTGNMGITFLYTQGLVVTTNANLPDAGEGTAYNQLIQANWGVPAYSWSMTAGTLPNGLALSASGNDYLLSGTPTVGSGGTYNFTVQVTDQDTPTSIDTKVMTLYVDGLKVVNANPLSDGQETVAYNETFTGINGPTPYTWSMISGALPSGLSLAPSGNTYVLSGTPAVGSTGNYQFELQVVDNNSSVGTKTFDLYIDWAPGALTYPCTEQNPATTGFGSSTSTSQRQYGYQFTCNSGGVTVYRLGSNMPAAVSSNANTCTLWNATTQAILGQVVTGPGSGWRWTDLASPVLLTNGQDYIVTVHCTHGWYSDTTASAAWIPTGDIQYVGARYVFTTSANAFPTTLYTGTRQYGVADIGYAKGLTITTDAQLPSGAEGTGYNTTIVAGFGTPAYSWTHVSGTLPTGLSLTPSGNDFILSGTPATGSLGTYNFTLRVTDTIPDTFDKTMTIFIMPPPASMPFTDDFSTDKGWQMDTGWQRGTAVAYSAAGPNRTEPGTDSSPSADNNILGHIIGADYAASMGTTVWATSPPIDCSGAASVSLRFERWLGCSLGDTAKIQVSNNGTTWTDVWAAPTGSNTNDTAWTFSGENLTTQAAGYPVVQFRFGIGPTNTVVNTGWCIDDVQLIDPGPELEVREGGPTGTPISDNEAVGGLRDFGQVIVGQTSTTLNISLYNNGLNTINIGAYNKVGSDPADFFVITAPAASIAPGMYTYMEVQFYRTTAGVSTCTIELPHDALGSGTAPFEINLTGEAIPLNPLIQVDMTTSGGTNIPHQDPATGTARDFGNVQVGSSSTPITIVLTNVGTGPLTISQVDMGGTWWTQFVVNNSGSMPTVLNALDTYSFTVAFQPTAAGIKDAHVRIYHNGMVATSPYEVPVLGNATTPGGPVINVDDGAGAVAHGAAAAGNRDFGNVQVGNTSTTTTITVTNNGASVMTVGVPVLGGANPGDFQLNTAGFGPTIAVGNSSTFTITFVPTSAGVKTATVTFTHDDPNVTSPFVINVTGNGTTTAAVLEVRETNAAGTILTNPAAATGILNFGSQDVTAGPTASAVIYVENTGTAALTLGTPVFNPVANTEFTINATGWPASLAVGNNASFSIAFDPTANGVQTGVIEFTHNDTTAGSPFVLNVTGTGVSPQVEVREGSVTGPVVTSGDAAVPAGGRDLGSIEVSAGATAAQTIVIINTGAATMTLGTPTLAGTNAADFILNTTGMAGALAPSANTTFTVAFDPTLAGIKDAQIEFTHDDTSAPSPFIIPVMGTATDPSGVLITTTTLPSGTSGTPYPAVNMAAIQGTAPYTWSLYSGILPSGLSLTPGGVLSGTPTTMATTNYTFVIRVTDNNNNTNERQFSIVIAGTVIPTIGGRRGGGCNVESGSSNIWIGLLSILALGALVYRRRETA